MNKYFSVFLVSVLAIPSSFAEEGHGHLHMPAHHKKDGFVTGGIADFQYVHRSQDSEHGAFSRRDVFVNDTEIHFHFAKTIDNGLRYGGVIELEADVTAANHDEGDPADKTYLFLENKFGRVELGSNSDVGHMMSVDASTLAAATGGIHGDYDLFVHFPHSGGDHIGLIHSPSLPLAHKHGASEDAAKITYISPRIKNLQFGLSFVPDSGDVGTASGSSGVGNDEQFENVINTAFNYQASYSDLAINSSLAIEFGDAENAAEEDLAAWTAGFNATYQSFTLGGSFGDWGRSMLEKASTSNDGRFWSAGIAYEYGDFNASLSYLRSDMDNNQTEVTSIGLDYRAIAGLTPYIEFNMFDVGPGDVSVKGNNGTVMLTGIKLAF